MDEVEEESEREAVRGEAEAAMQREDPRRLREEVERVGAHLVRTTRLDALTRVERQFRSNNLPYSSSSSSFSREAEGSGGGGGGGDKASIHEFESVDDLAAQVGAMFEAAKEGLGLLHALMERKDVHFATLKKELVAQKVEKSQREEGACHSHSFRS